MIKLVSFATLTAVVVVLFLGIDGLYFEPSPGSFLSEDDPELMAFSRVAREFGDTGTVMVVLNSSGLSLEKLKEVTQKIDGLDWVNTVASVFDAVELGKLNLLTLQIPKTEYVYQSGEKLVLNMDILNDPFYRDLIISSDGEYYGVLITVASGNEFKSGSNILSLKATLKELGINEYRLIGESVANSTTFRSIMDLTFVYPPFIFLAIFTVYMVKFRRISLALLTLVPPAGAAVLVVGIMGLIKTQINSLTVMIPSFIVIIGSAYGMHFLSRFQENCAKQENPIRRTIHEERVPILFSALTTMAGFSSYILLDMRAFRDMGILVCVGIFSSAVFTLIILPGLVSTKWCASVVLTASPVEISPKIRKALMWVIVVMSAISPLLIMTIPMNIDQYAFFKENSEIRRNAEKMKEAFGWLTNYTLMITPKGGGKLAITGEQASQLVDFQKELEALEGISKVLSPVDISRQTNIPLPLLIRVLDNTGVLGSATSLMISQRAMRINLFSPTSDSLSAEKLKDSVKELIARYPLLKPDTEPGGLFRTNTPFAFHDLQKRKIHFYRHYTYRADHSFQLHLHGPIQNKPEHLNGPYFRDAHGFGDRLRDTLHHMAPKIRRSRESLSSDGGCHIHQRIEPNRRLLRSFTDPTASVRGCCQIDGERTGGGDDIHSDSPPGDSGEAMEKRQTAR